MADRIKTSFFVDKCNYDGISLITNLCNETRLVVLVKI